MLYLYMGMRDLCVFFICCQIKVVMNTKRLCGEIGCVVCTDR